VKEGRAGRIDYAHNLDYLLLLIQLLQL